MSVGVRPARAADRAAIRQIHLAAFPTPAEANLVEALGAAGDSVLSLVAILDERVVGHVLLSRMRATIADGEIQAVGLAPVAVLPEAQRSGVGGALIRAAIDRARADGEAIIFVLGDPAYYGRFGFNAQVAARFETAYPGPHMMALTVGSGMAGTERGIASYAPAFDCL